MTTATATGKKSSSPASAAEKGKIAVIRIRGQQHISVNVRKTFESLRLYKQNYCVIIDNNPISQGMLRTIKDYATWGEVSSDMIAKLREKRLEHFIDHDGKKKEKKFFRLNPPLKGFERKGIKIPYNKGGALGYRGENINLLLSRMI